MEIEGNGDLPLLQASCFTLGETLFPVFNSTFLPTLGFTLSETLFPVFNSTFLAVLDFTLGAGMGLGLAAGIQYVLFEHRILGVLRAAGHLRPCGRIAGDIVEDVLSEAPTKYRPP